MIATPWVKATRDDRVRVCQVGTDYIVQHRMAFRGAQVDRYRIPRDEWPTHPYDQMQYTLRLRCLDGHRMADRVAEGAVQAMGMMVRFPPGQPRWEPWPPIEEEP